MSPLYPLALARRLGKSMQKFYNFSMVLLAAILYKLKENQFSNIC